jgi:hypothetical protein
LSGKSGGTSNRRLDLNLIIIEADYQWEGERPASMIFPDRLMQSVGFVLNKTAERVVRLAEAKIAALDIQTKGGMNRWP